MAIKHNGAPDAITEEEMTGTAIPGRSSIQHTQPQTSISSNACKIIVRTEGAILISDSHRIDVPKTQAESTRAETASRATP